MSAGIDYGMGRTNIDLKTGIRFGCISQNSVMLEYTDIEYDYGEATCPKCGNAVRDVMIADDVAIDSDGNEIEFEQYGHGCADFVCTKCCHTLDSQDVYSEEALGWSYSGDGYEIVDCLDNDMLILKSEFYTMAPFCSPCVPGACSIESSCDDGAKAYCLGHNWFESGVAPYPVYSVATGELVEPRKV